MAKKSQWNTKMFTDYVFETFGDEFEVRGDYIGNQTKILMYHTECDREFEVRPGNFKIRKRCPLCHGTFKKSTEQFKKEVQSLDGNEHEVLGEYSGAKENVLMKHNKCGSDYNVTPTDFLSGGNRCPECAKNKKKDTKAFKKEVCELIGDEYEVVGDYTTSKMPILIKHNICGYKFEKTPELFLIGLRCPDCGLKRRSGENHYKYNPDLTQEERLRRDMFNGEIRKWRELVFIRDNFTCKICNVKGGRLNAHHINSWNKHEDDRFILDNGITLCEDCHKNFHFQYGYGNNTRKQFEKFAASF